LLIAGRMYELPATLTGSTFLQSAISIT
jgi:hypothetical protein